MAQRQLPNNRYESERRPIEANADFEGMMGKKLIDMALEYDNEGVKYLRLVFEGGWVFGIAYEGDRSRYVTTGPGDPVVLALRAAHHFQTLQELKEKK
jgi:hypothetical protein